jgi:hypothetical protein
VLQYKGRSTQSGLFYCSEKMSTAKLRDESGKFLLFLENHDGNSFNAMMRDLCKIYALSQEGHFDFLPSAVSRATTFTDSHFSVYWAKFAESRDYFFANKPEIVAFVATELAISALKEFEIGNLY